MEDFETAFFVALSLMSSAGSDASRVLNSSPMDFARSVFRFFWFFSAANTLAYAACFISGFFLLPWWLALLALPISWIGGAVVSLLLHPLFAPIKLLAGVIVAVIAFVL
jgi:hypothetical protein